jgi:cytochrome c-type biogenesis protein CcmE
MGFGSASGYYVTVSEFYDKGTELYDTDLRIAGVLADSPVEWNADAVELRFAVTEGGESIDVVYNGAKPSNFEAGTGILVEGRYQSDGLFHATQLILKCPSKYEIEE